MRKGRFSKWIRNTIRWSVLSGMLWMSGAQSRASSSEVEVFLKDAAQVEVADSAFSEALRPGSLALDERPQLSRAKAMFSNRAVLVKSDAAKIQDLVLEPLPVEVHDTGNAFFAELSGTFPRKGATLLVALNKVSVDEQGRFQYAVRVTREITKLELASIDEQGALETETVFLFWPAFEEGRQSGSRLRFRPALMVSRLTYAQTGVATLEETALTIKVSASRTLPWPGWEAGGNLYVTALPLAAAPAGAAMRFFGGNLRAGYSFSPQAASWKLVLNAGAFMASTLEGPRGVGYQSLFGPQLFPVLSYSLPTGQDLAISLKYSPISAGGLALMDPVRNRELAAGASFLFQPARVMGWRRLGVTVDYSDLKIQVGAITGRSTSFSVGGFIGL